MNLNEVLIRPLITEKNTMLSSQGRYTFEVDQRANKPIVRRAVEQIFKVDVTAVNIINVPPKTRRVGRSVGKTSPWKKAIVTLRPGQRIEVFEGV
ncbi:MAG TPA: 50S ribosomal protein L23 [Chloroflexota bacterium]|nr:50S ribosomal protein L23 [Chloroflexota bacterium]